MDHTIVDPNQLSLFYAKFNDNAMSGCPLSIITVDNEFCMKIFINGTITYADNH